MDVPYECRYTNDQPQTVLAYDAKQAAERFASRYESRTHWFYGFTVLVRSPENKTSPELSIEVEASLIEQDGIEALEFQAVGILF